LQLFSGYLAALRSAVVLDASGGPQRTLRRLAREIFSVSNLFFSLLVGALVAGAVFVVADKFRSLMAAGSGEFAAVPGRHGLVQGRFDNESQGQQAAFNPYKRLGTKIAFAIPFLAALVCLVWSRDALYDLFAAAREHVGAIEEQITGPADAGYATFSADNASGASGASGGWPLTQSSTTTVSGGGPGFINRVVSGFAVPFREYHWHQPVEHHFSGSGNTWAGSPHGGVPWRQPAPSFSTTVSRPAMSMASRPRR
jgi:hypothetical protein